MKSMFLLVLCSVVLISCTKYEFGEKSPTSKMVYRERLLYEAIPWKKRVKYFEYTGSEGLRIKAISCFDYQYSEATVNITEGGIGSNHVTLRFKSQRSYRIDYDVEIYD